MREAKLLRKISLSLANALAIVLFLTTTAILVGSLAANSLWVSKFKTTAMRFIPSEAISFVVIPNLDGFMTHGSSAFRAIISNLTAKPAEADFVALLVPPPKLEDVELPTPCIKISSLSDLEEAGFDPRGSASVARLDYGSRIAVQVRDDGRALEFLSEVLNPIYLRLSAPSRVTRKDGDSDEEAAEANFKFSIKLSPRGVAACLNDGGPESKTGVTYVPLRVVGSRSGEIPAVDADCSVETEQSSRESCKCELVIVGLGENLPASTQVADCRTSDALVERQRGIEKLKNEIGSGKTVAIGNHYLAKFDSFYLIDSLSNVNAPRNFKISEPRSSIVRDDSFLQHFGEILEEGKRFSATVLAGARPDWVLENASAGLRGIPLYLMTPIGLHFRNDDVYVRALTNLEPQDMAVIQMLAARDKQDALPRSWSRWRDGLGAKISDNSLKIYARFVRAYFPDADLQLLQIAPLAPVVIDVMEEGASALVASINDLNEDGKSARVAIAVPNISAEYAGRLVSQVRRQLMLRQGALLAEAVGRYALEMDIPQQRLSSSVPQLMCESQFYEIKSIAVKKFDPESPSTATIRSVVNLRDSGLSPEASWVASTEDPRLQRLLPFEDANAALWGEAYGKTKGVIRTDQENVDSEIEKFTNILSQLEAAGEEDDRFPEQLAEQGPLLLQMAQSLEARRSTIRNEVPLSAVIKEIIAGKDSDEALVELKKLNSGLQQRLDDRSLMNSEEIKQICKSIDQTVKASPVALYDEEVKALYFLDSVEQAVTLPKVAEERDAAGKLLISFVTTELIDLLKKGKAPSGTIDKVERFPFSGIQVLLTGRDTGAGVEGRFYLTKLGGKR